MHRTKWGSSYSWALLHGYHVGQSWPCLPRAPRGYRTTALMGAWGQDSCVPRGPNVRLAPYEEPVSRSAHMISPQLELEASSLGFRCAGFMKLKEPAAIWAQQRTVHPRRVMPAPHLLAKGHWVSVVADRAWQSPHIQRGELYF